MNGSSAVTLSGTASVIHHAAIQTTSPATIHASPLMPLGAGASQVMAKASGPASRPICLAVMKCVGPLDYVCCIVAV